MWMYLCLWSWLIFDPGLKSDCMNRSRKAGTLIWRQETRLFQLMAPSQKNAVDINWREAQSSPALREEDPCCWTSWTKPWYRQDSGLLWTTWRPAPGRLEGRLLLCRVRGLSDWRRDLWDINHVNKVLFFLSTHKQNPAQSPYIMKECAFVLS